MRTTRCATQSTVQNIPVVLGRRPEIYSKRLNAKEVKFSKQGEFIFPIADGRLKTLGGDQDLKTSTLVRHRPIQGESNIDFLGESERVSSTTSRLTSGCR